jgi:hypothetical protein
VIRIGIDPKQINRIREALLDKASRLPREVATAVNATAKKVRFEASKELRKALAVPVKILKKSIQTKSSASKDHLRAIVRLWKGHPIPLKYFKPRQVKGRKATKKRGAVEGGVTYKINPAFGARSILRGAFIMRPSGHVAQRIGKERFPVLFMHGPSPGESFDKLGITMLAWKVARQELPKQMERRVRFLLLKNSGGLRGKQK